MKKTFYLLYGLVSYVIFLLAFLYAIGFVAGAFVPKDINSPPLFEFKYPWLLNALLLGIFAIQHSVMARPAFKRWWTRIVPEPIERSTFVLIASLLLSAMYFLWQPLPGVIWSIGEGPIAVALVLISMVGWMIVLISTFLINHFDLFGLRQVWLQFRGRPYSHLIFRKKGLYKYVRHPLMFGFLIAFWATPNMTVGHIIFALLTTGYILVALLFEERDLINMHGENYLKYKKEVPRLIPFTRRKVRETASPITESQQRERA